MQGINREPPRVPVVFASDPHPDAVSCEQLGVLGGDYNRVEGGTLRQEKSHGTHLGISRIAEESTPARCGRMVTRRLAQKRRQCGGIHVETAHQ